VPFLDKVFLGNEPCQYCIRTPRFGDHHLPSLEVDVMSVGTAHWVAQHIPMGQENTTDCTTLPIGPSTLCISHPKSYSMVQIQSTDMRTFPTPPNDGDDDKVSQTLGKGKRSLDVWGSEGIVPPVLTLAQDGGYCLSASAVETDSGNQWIGG
jgi:hypothetical protein